MIRNGNDIERRDDCLFKGPRKTVKTFAKLVNAYLGFELRMPQMQIRNQSI
jgi:hypothetical protein